jgi:hypothetical protein
MCRWSVPSQLTTGITVLTANQGVDVSAGRVTKPFELFPSMFADVPSAALRAAAVIPIDSVVATEDLPHYVHHKVLLQLDRNSTIFVENQFLRMVLRKKGIFFRVLRVNASDRSILCRIEMVNLWIWPGELLPCTCLAVRK